jgi:hypothetical protein
MEVSGQLHTPLALPPGKEPLVPGSELDLVTPDVFQDRSVK